LTNLLAKVTAWFWEKKSLEHSLSQEERASPKRKVKNRVLEIRLVNYLIFGEWFKNSLCKRLGLFR
ncbi:MAG: hypothetical protein Q8O01_00900, partial [Candidatus Omnitrophota bacterium]|nr:hypothetical protein [Candidatus Omnitrophota bacterium]